MVKVEQKEREHKVVGFPKLMVAYDSIIVMMTGRTGVNGNDGCGTCLCSSYDSARVGEYASDWNFRAFEDYDGELTISNMEG